MDPEKDSYSVFEAFDSRGNSFSNLLNSLGIEELYLGGLATDYCVRATALDAIKCSFKVKLLIDAIKGVNQGDSRQAIREMVRKGARKIFFDGLTL
jgi:nicotinamidase/pyrazinamidase